MDKKEIKPYSPKKTVHIHLDLKDITEKAIKIGPLAVLAEAVLNLSLLANDHMTRMATGGAGPATPQLPKGKSNE